MYWRWLLCLIFLVTFPNDSVRSMEAWGIYTARKYPYHAVWRIKGFRLGFSVWKEAVSTWPTDVLLQCNRCSSNVGWMVGIANVGWMVGIANVGWMVGIAHHSAHIGRALYIILESIAFPSLLVDVLPADPVWRRLGAIRWSALHRWFVTATCRDMVGALHYPTAEKHTLAAKISPIFPRFCLIWLITSYVCYNRRVCSFRA